MHFFAARKLALATGLVALVSNVQGQGADTTNLLQGLGSSCTNSLLGLVSESPVAQCLGLSDIVGELTSLGDASIVDPLGAYFKQTICPVAPCKEADLANATATVGAGCQQEVAKAENPIPGAILFLLSDYKLVREIGCLTNNNTGDYCLVDSMRALQTTTKQNITLASIASLISNERARNQAFTALGSNKDALCTDCNKAILSTYFQAVATTSTSSAAPAATQPASGDNKSQSTSGSTTAQLQALVSQQCPATFTDGKIPDTVKPGTAEAASASAAGAQPTPSAKPPGSKAPSSEAAAVSIPSVAIYLSLLGFALACIM